MAPFFSASPPWYLHSTERLLHAHLQGLYVFHARNTFSKALLMTIEDILSHLLAPNAKKKERESNCFPWSFTVKLKAKQLNSLLFYLIFVFFFFIWVQERIISNWKQTKWKKKKGKYLCKVWTGEHYKDCLIYNRQFFLGKITLVGFFFFPTMAENISSSISSPWGLPHISRQSRP